MYVVDTVGKSNITEISVNASDLQHVCLFHIRTRSYDLFRGTILSSHSLGTNSSGTDISIFSGSGNDHAYVNAPAYHSVHTYKISAPGHFELIQRFNYADMPQDIVISAGFAVVGDSVSETKEEQVQMFQYTSFDLGRRSSYRLGVVEYPGEVYVFPSRW